MKLERDAFYAMLGIAMRAGQLSLGESGVLKTVSSGTALFMILDADASDNTKKKFRDSCAFYKVPLYETSPDRLGQAIGKPGRMSAAIARGTLGEKLLDGFARGAGDVAAWFEDFSARLAGAQAQMAALAQSAADTFYDGRRTAQAAQSPATPAVTVNQTVEFNQPVETPAQVARRMEEVNEALALML